jgi:hypothetical protein
VIAAPLTVTALVAPIAMALTTATPAPAAPIQPAESSAEWIVTEAEGGTPVPANAPPQTKSHLPTERPTSGATRPCFIGIVTAIR